MKLQLDKTSDTPIYLQITDQIQELIRKGELISGEKLPTERELKREYNISVGTVKAAYKKLAQMNKVISVQGSGTYVARMQTELEMSHLRAEIDQLLNRALSAEITEEQIRDILEQEIARFKCRMPNVHIAWVCACEELLETTVTELAHTPLVRLDSFTVAQIRQNPSLLQNHYDLIITTERYYEELCRLAPSQMDCIYQISLTLNWQSIYEIAQIQEEVPILFWCVEDVFEKTVRRYFLQNRSEKTLFSVTGQEPGEDTLTRFSLLVVPPQTTLSRHPGMLSKIQYAAQNGVRVLHVDYKLDRGSLLFLRTLVRNVWSDKCRNGFSEIDGNLEFHRLNAPRRCEAAL